MLLAKARVRDVALPRTDGGAETPHLRPATVELVLAGGDALLGEVLLDAPQARPRLLDFLNRVTQRFITLHTADGIRLVNSRLIERVRPLD